MEKCSLALFFAQELRGLCFACSDWLGSVGRAGYSGKHYYHSILSVYQTGPVDRNGCRTATGILALPRNVIHPLIDDRHSAFITTCKTSVREKVNEANQSS
jgi:hypothetical protein